jgi:hypothetical protein
MWKGHVSYYFLGLNEIKSYFKQNNSSLFKTYANFSWFKAIAMWASGMLCVTYIQQIYFFQHS